APPSRSPHSFPTRRSSDLVGVALSLVSPVLAGDPTKAPSIVPLVNPVSEKGAAGLFNKIVMAHGAEIDPGRTVYHMIRAIEPARSEEHTSELQSRFDLVCR